jgi:hypothetical protein
VIDLATTGLESRNMAVGGNVSSCSVVKRLAVSEGREELAVDDEGNDLLLNSERGAGGVVVSKKEVAVRPFSD